MTCIHRGEKNRLFVGMQRRLEPITCTLICIFMNLNGEFVLLGERWSYHLDKYTAGRQVLHAIVNLILLYVPLYIFAQIYESPLVSNKSPR